MTVRGGRKCPATAKRPSRMLFKLGTQAGVRVKFAEPLPCVLPPIFSFYVPKMMALYENLCRRAKKRAALQAASQHDGPPHSTA